jgi:O-antigen ligase
VFLARPFALFAIIAVARQLARFHAGEKAGLVIAIWLTALVFLSQSRLGMLAILVMYPLSFLLLGGRKNIAMAVMMLVVGVSALTVLILSSDDLQRRFFGEDASMSVGGVAINASGRTTAWAALLNDINGPLRLLFGAGAGAGSLFCQLNLYNFPHPHNDYLRYLFDFGVVGLVWFLAFVVIAIRMVWVRIRADRLNADAKAFAQSYGTLLAMIGALASMATDNSGIYIYVMGPLGIMLGVTLCRTPAGPPRGQNLDWVFASDAAPTDAPPTRPQRRPVRVMKREARR